MQEADLSLDTVCERKLALEKADEDCSKSPPLTLRERQEQAYREGYQKGWEDAKAALAAMICKMQEDKTWLLL